MKLTNRYCVQKVPLNLWDLRKFREEEVHTQQQNFYDYLPLKVATDFLGTLCTVLLNFCNKIPKNALVKSLMH